MSKIEPALFFQSNSSNLNQWCGLTVYKASTWMQISLRYLSVADRCISQVSNMSQTLRSITRSHLQGSEFVTSYIYCIFTNSREFMEPGLFLKIIHLQVNTSQQTYKNSEKACLIFTKTCFHWLDENHYAHYGVYLELSGHTKNQKDR